MALRKYKPTTAGTRWRIGNAYAELTKTGPEKSLVEMVHHTAGRNRQGRRSMRYLGGGHKKMYRLIDFKRDKKDIPATVKTIEYDPHRSAFIALVSYADGEKRYIIAPQGLQVGATILSGDSVAPDLGNALMLKNMPLGTTVHNVEMQPTQGGKLVRSAGASAQLANTKSPSIFVASTPGPIGKSVTTLPSSALITISFCGVRQPMKSSRFLMSIDMPTGPPPGATDHRAVTFLASRSTTTTTFLSTRLI